MKTLTNFLKLPWIDKKLILKTLFLMIFVRLLLWTIPFPYIQRNIKKISNKTSKNDISVEKIIWAVQVVSLYLPRTTCLTTALTAHILLSRENYPSQIKIGVGKDAEGQFEAHAWLEHDDTVIIGESEKDYVPLLDLNIEK